MAKTSFSPREAHLVVGKKVSAGVLSWKGADLTHTYYVGNVDINVTKEDMKQNIEGQGVAVVELEEIPQRHNRSKSFKLCIRRRDAEIIKDDEFWPEGIVVRRFYFSRKKDGDGTAVQS